jgi:hypothetical protein
VRKTITSVALLALCLVSVGCGGAAQRAVNASTSAFCKQAALDKQRFGTGEHPADQAAAMFRGWTRVAPTAIKRDVQVMSEFLGSMANVSESDAPAPSAPPAKLDTFMARVGAAQTHIGQYLERTCHIPAPKA